MFRKILGFKYYTALLIILVVIVISLIILGIQNFYKYNAQKEILSQKVTIFLNIPIVPENAEILKQKTETISSSENPRISDIFKAFSGEDSGFVFKFKNLYF